MNLSAIITIFHSKENHFCLYLNWVVVAIRIGYF